MPILKLEIFQNSKSQKCKLWARPPPFLEKVYILIFFYDGFPKLLLSSNPQRKIPASPQEGQVSTVAPQDVTQIYIPNIYSTSIYSTDIFS